METIIMLIVMVAIFYFLLIRPAKGKDTTPPPDNSSSKTTAPKQSSRPTKSYDAHSSNPTLSRATAHLEDGASSNIFSPREEKTENSRAVAYCAHCGVKLASHAKFCHVCGTANHPIENRQPKREYEYAGKIIKCPSCGEVLASFQTTCPACGHEIREGRASSAIREFADKLEAIENGRNSQKKKNKKTNEDGLTFVDEQKISLISSFPIPNTKEDLFEFFTMAAANVNDKRYNYDVKLSPSQMAVSDAWEAKFEQTYHKALLAVQSPIELEPFQRIYQQKTSALSQAKTEAKKSEKNEAIQSWILVLLSILFFIFVCCFFDFS